MADTTGDVAVTLPTPHLLAGDLPIGAVVLALPTPQLSVIASTGYTASVALTLPMPVLAITGFVTQVATVRLTLPSLTMQAQGFTGAVGNIALTLPMPTLRIGEPAGVALTLPTPTLQAQGFTGSVANVALYLPTPTLDIEGSEPFTAGVRLVLPTPTLSISGTVGNVANVNLTLRSLALAIEGMSGTLGTVSMTLPVLKLDSRGYGPQVGVAQLVLPMLQLQVTGYESDGKRYSTLAMHTETKALWTYDNFHFNSYAKFNGVYLGASDDGIFALSGATDNGKLIQAAARVGITDFGTSFLKRVDRAYVGYRTDGNLIVRVFTDEVHVRDYLLASSHSIGLHGNHTRIGKGLAARYWQFEIRNQHGADFQLNVIELKPTHLRRRIGGNDA